MTRSQKALWLALLGLAIFIFWWQLPERFQQFVIQGQTMGTYYVVKVVVPRSESIDEAELTRLIDERLARINHIMSTYDKSSELSVFNQSTSAEPQVISSELAYVMDEAIRLGELTGHALDVTVGPLVNLWGFGPEGRPDVVPSDEQITLARQSVGLAKLQLSGQGLSKAHPLLYVDLSAIAKGYGVDEIAKLLSQRGYPNVMVDIGGELALHGHNANREAWRIAIERPVAGERSVQQILSATNMGIATSGDYRNYFEADGVRFSHTIDPKTARPISHKLVSVTVIHPATMTADGLATALMVMGNDAGMAWADSIGLAVYMVVKTESGFEGMASSAMRPYLVNPSL